MVYFERKEKAKGCFFFAVFGKVGIKEEGRLVGQIDGVQ